MKKAKILIGGALFAFGCGFFLYPNFREWRTQNEVDQIIERFEKTYNEDIEKDETPPISPNNNETTTPKVQDATETTDILPSIIPDETITGTSAISKAPESPNNDLTADKDNNKDQAKNNSHRPYNSLYEELLEYNQNLINNGQSIVDAWSYEQEPIDLADMGQNDSVIGYIEIPDMEIRLPLFLGASKDNLKKGAAVLSQTSMPIGGDSTNCVIAGHRGWEGSAYFQFIENMKNGSKVYITNPWETLVYECVSIQIIYPDDVSAILIQPGKDLVTLLSCHPYMLGGGPYRYLVYCERVGTQERQTAEEGAINPDLDKSMQTGSLNDIVVDHITKEPQIMEKSNSTDVENPETINSSEQKNLAPAEIIVQSEGLDLLALEQTLRYILPLSVFAISLVVVFYKQHPKKKNRKKNNAKNKRRKKRSKKYEI